MSQIKEYLSSDSRANDTSVTSVDCSKIFPSFPSNQSVKEFLMKHPSAWNNFLKFPPEVRHELLDFCTGRHGLRITYDPVFRRIFNPETHRDRLESLLSSILDRQVSILEILPREGTRLSETGSFIIMDILVRLDDGSYANIEMQKIGYNFPLARADCYASDIIMRQYEKIKSERGQKFSFNDLHKIYCIILMEQSPEEFHSVKDKYIHMRTAAFDTGIYKNNAGLHEDIFLCLDTFHSIVHNITKSSTSQDSWLTFLSSEDISEISELVRNFPMFLPIYQEIAEFAQKPEELMSMFSEALYIMDKNMERLMVEEMKEKLKDTIAASNAEIEAVKKKTESEINAIKAKVIAAQAEVDTAKAEADTAKVEANTAKVEADTAKTEADILRQRLSGKSPEEIAASLSVTLDMVNDVLSSVTQSKTLSQTAEHQN